MLIKELLSVIKLITEILVVLVANVAPPPGIMWFYLDPQADELRPSAAQIWGCADEACSAPVLLQTWGECSAPGCLPGAAAITQATGSLGRFECGGGRCRSSAFEYGQPYFRLGLQLPGGFQTHAGALPLPSSYGERLYWSVTRDPAGLALAPTDRRPHPALPVPPFMAFFGLTLVIELLAAGLFLYWRHRPDAPTLVARLALLALINLLSYPVVWGFFPAMQRWTSQGVRSLAWALPALTLLLAGLLWGMFNASNRRRRIFWLLLAVALLIGGVTCLALYGFSVNYGYPPEVAAGLPGWLVLLLAELYAVGVEGLLLWGFTRGEIALRPALTLSLIMNAASFIVGVLLAW